MVQQPHLGLLVSACCTRILTSKVMQDVNNCLMYWVVEMWFIGSTAWHHLATETADKIKAPSWAKEGEAPLSESRI